MNKPEVSVLLPFYNAGTTLERALQSIRNQSLEEFECILVDNNSSDNSAEIAEAMTQTDQRFRLYQEKVQGVVFASNTAAEYASGKYIARMDADDWSFPERLKLQAEFLENNPGYGAVSGLVDHIGYDEKNQGMVRYVNWVNSVLSYDEIMISRFIELPVVNPSAMWRREVHETHGLYSHGEFPEDYEMWLRWMTAGVKICKLDQPVIKWYDSPGRLTRTNPVYKDSSFYTIKTKYLAEWLQNNNPFHPVVVVWGPSRLSRRRAKLIEDYGIRIDYFIDIKKTRQLEEKIVFYEDLPPAGNSFILVYIRLMRAKEAIIEILNQKGYKEGRDFLMIS